MKPTIVLRMMMVASKAGGTKHAASSAARNRNRLTLVLVGLGITAAAVMPYGIKRLRDGRPLYSSDKPLTGSQIMRGAYINSSSQDIGPDPDFDFKTGEWSGRRNNPHKK